MLKKNQRLSRTQFPKKRPTRRHAFSWGSVALYEPPPFGAAVVVSKKVARKAHERNRLRRRIYAALEGAARNTSAPKARVAIFPRREALSAPFVTLIQDIAAARTNSTF